MRKKTLIKFQFSAAISTDVTFSAPTARHSSAFWSNLSTSINRPPRSTCFTLTVTSSSLDGCSESGHVLNRSHHDIAVHAGAVSVVLTVHVHLRPVLHNHEAAVPGTPQDITPKSVTGWTNFKRGQQTQHMSDVMQRPTCNTIVLRTAVGNNNTRIELYICIPTNCTQLIYFINNTLKHMYCLKL